MLKFGLMVTDYDLNPLDDAVDSANRLLWYIDIRQREENWYVCAGLGEVTLLVTDNREAAEAFVYGMGLAYSVISEDVTEGYLLGLGLDQEYDEYLEYVRQRKEKEEGDT
jgi:hypothetical protein